MELGEENAFAMDSVLGSENGDLSWGSQHFFTLVRFPPHFYVLQNPVRLSPTVLVSNEPISLDVKDETA